MKKIAVFPGSFDPITRGHEDIILRAAPLFDELIIAIGSNSNKKYMFSEEKRKTMLQKTFGHVANIKIDSYEGLTIKYVESIGAQYMLRGLRTSADFEFERNIAALNLGMNPNIETVFVISSPEYSALSSSVVREIMMHGGDASPFLPEKLSE